MNFNDFEMIMSVPRAGRYLAACGQDHSKAIELYRVNLELSQALFALISCFEVALRNAIDRQYTLVHGPDWLRSSAQPGGFFDTPSCKRTLTALQQALSRFGPRYSHPKMMSALEFGFWRYLFAQPQFHAGGQCLLKAFPHKPSSSKARQYNHTYVFNELGRVNDLRNRIAHHEPICFTPGTHQKDSAYATTSYTTIHELTQWLDIDLSPLLRSHAAMPALLNRIDHL